MAAVVLLFLRYNPLQTIQKQLLNDLSNYRSENFIMFFSSLSCGFDTFTEEIFNGIFHFCAV